MCARFAQSNKWSKTKSFQFVKNLEEPKSRYNIVYSEKATIILKPGKDYFVEDGVFSLLPNRAKTYKEAISYTHGNAKTETIFELPTFKDPIINSRCIIPFDALFESNGEPKHKQPYAIRKFNDEPLGVAGISNRFVDRETGKSYQSFAIITVVANSLVAKYHPKLRMPVFLEDDQFEKWLDPSMRAERDIDNFLKTYPSEKMHAYPVSTKILATKENRMVSENCLMPIPEPPEPKIQMSLF
ncbi:SOS response-associated peptidase [Leptospira kmetyi]|uniref:SOS response-associated peptidase n=1 Tax=Leptospira kmetyi TaxID=408139 RepID=UPI000288B6A8|nr:SOS response-associated peptidase [Leptospira kmetyi]EQA55360.1 hypothetical protein LEP1GSC052_0040 [Leptospira kmetyi serovar Malaysia str. Bejo-Iso9]